MISAGTAVAHSQPGRQRRGPGRSRFRPGRHAAVAALAACLCLSARGALGVSQDSPEVLAMVDKALTFLEQGNASGPYVDDLGAKCLVGLAFLKRGISESHPKVQEALDACRQDVASEEIKPYLYGKCLAIIFLTELDSTAHRELIEVYAAQVKQHQKPHGGFGYISATTGDTSQTQYAALAFWSMHVAGISVDADSVQRCVNWIMRTRDPTGVWGYQGEDPGSFNLVAQQDQPGRSMAAAGMSTAMILGNMLGLLKPPAGEEAAPQEADGENVPAALRRVDTGKRKLRAPPLPPGNVDPKRLDDAIRAGRGWFDKNFGYEVPQYQSYYVYSVERYMSFQEYLDGDAPEEPQWYNAGYEFLKKTQSADGSWNDHCGTPSATAFSVLFLLRSTQKSIAAALGEGTLVGGRGLPRDLSKVRVRGGKLVYNQPPTEVDALLEMLEEDQAEAFDDLLDNPAALDIADIEAADAQRLQQVVRSGPAGARLLAVRALAKLRSVEQAPTLIYALTDPDRRVVREARDGLRSISRNFEGFGPPDNFDDAQRQQAVERWKAWYRSIRPDAAPLP